MAAGREYLSIGTIAMFHRLGYGVLIFDYRGYGRSTGQPSEAGLYRDAQTAWDRLTRQRGIALGRIVLFGESLGGAVAAWLPARWLIRLRYDTRAALPGAGRP